MNDIRACLLGVQSYIDNSRKVIDLFKANKELVVEFLEFAANFFETKEELLRKYLLLLLIRDSIKQKNSTLINKLANHKQLYGYLVGTVDFLSSMDDPSKGLYKFPDDDPQIAIKYFNLILEMLMHLALTYPQGANNKSTKFKIIYHQLLDKQIIFPKQFIEWEANVNELLTENQNQPQGQVPQNKDQELQNLNELQVEIMEQIETVYDILNSSNSDPSGLQDMFAMYQLQFEQQEYKLVQLRKQIESELNNQQISQLDLLNEFVAVFSNSFERLKRNQSNYSFGHFKNSVLQIASQIMNKQYTPQPEFSENQKQQYIQNNEVDDEEQDQQFYHNQSTQVIGQQKLQSQYQQQQQQYQQSQQSQQQQYNDNQNANKIKQTESVYPEQQQIHNSKLKPTFQDLYSQPPVPNSMKLTFGSNIYDDQAVQQDEEIAQQQKFQSQYQTSQNSQHSLDHQYYEQKHEIPKKSKYQYEQESNSENTVPQFHNPERSTGSNNEEAQNRNNIHQSLVQQIPTEVSLNEKTNTIKSQRQNNDHFDANSKYPQQRLVFPPQVSQSSTKLEQLFSKYNYSNQQMNQWKRTCLSGEGIIFENYLIQISAVLRKNYQILNQKTYLNISLKIINKTEDNYKIEIDYEGDQQTKVWIKPVQLQILQQELQQQIIIGETFTLITGTISIQNQFHQFLLPNTLQNYVEFLNLHHSIFRQKLHNAQLYHSQPFQLRVQRENLKLMKFCEINGSTYGSVYGNQLIQLQQNYESLWVVSATEENMMILLSFLFS